MSSSTARCARAAPEKMRRVALHRALTLLILCVAGSAARSAPAAPCAPAALAIDRGETRRLVICAAGLPDAYSLVAPAGLEVSYQQRLRRCGIGDDRPGIHLVVRATDAAQSGVLTLTAGPAAAPVCDAISVSVPERLRLPDAGLSRRAHHADSPLELRIKAPAGIDLSAACQGGPSIATSDGMMLVAVDAARCARSTLRWNVAPLDGRQQPAKIILPAVKRADGTVTEAVTYAVPPAPRWLSAMAEADAKFVDIDGVRTRYFEKGRGETLLLVHGGQPSSMDGTAWDWQQNFDGLAEHFHVYALDRLGQGYTANPANLDDYADYYPRVVAHLHGFMRALGMTRVHLVGHSQGSWPVTRIALDHPDEVATLTIVDGGIVAPARGPGATIGFYMYLSQNLHPAGGESLESTRRGMEMFSWTRNNLTDQRVGRIVAMTKQEKFAQAQAWFARSGMSPAHPSFRALKAQLIADFEAGQLRVPVLVVWGRNDPEGSLESGIELYRLVSASSPRADLHVFGQSGHISFIEHPEEFNRLLTDFAR